MNKRRRYKAKRRHAARKGVIRELDRIAGAAFWRMAREQEADDIDLFLHYRVRGDDDGVEYGHPGDRLRGLE